MHAELLDVEHTRSSIGRWRVTVDSRLSRCDMTASHRAHCLTNMAAFAASLTGDACAVAH